MTTPPYIVDHRYAQSQVRHDLLEHLDLLGNNLEVVAVKSGLAVQRLVGVCFGRVGLTYWDMARLVRAMRGEATELFVTMHWIECGQSCSLEEPNGIDKLSDELLATLQAGNKLPTSV